MPQSTAAANDLRLRLSDRRWLSYGQYGDPRGKPVIYMHGGLSSRLDIAFADKVCADRGIRLIAPDRPGMGRSDRQPNRSMLDWAADISELALQLDLGRFPVFGWSLGGPYALVCAYQLPHLVTIAGTIGGVAPFERPRAIGEPPSIVDRMIISATGPVRNALAIALTAARYMPESLVRWSLLSETKAEIDREIIGQMSVAESTAFLYEGSRQGGLGIMDDYAAVGRKWGFELGEIAQRVLIWHGEKDLLCPMTGAEYLQDHIPAGKLEVVAGLGHFLLHRKLGYVLDELFFENECIENKVDSPT